MPVNIVRYKPEHVPAVRRLNERLRDAQETWQFPEQPESRWLPDSPGEEIKEHYYVALDGDEARGGYILKWQPFWTGTSVKLVCCLYLPLSEGIINPAYKLLGLGLIRDAMKRNPRVFCLGMGGAARPLPQTLAMLGWQVHDIPFFFLPVSAGPFLRHLQPLQSRVAPRLAARLASASGVGALALAVYKWLRRPPCASSTGLSWELVQDFGSWADDVWQAARPGYALCADRSSGSLGRLYPDREGENRRVKVCQNGTVVGWVVVRSRSMKGHKYFGDMQVGSLIDGMASPGKETSVVWAARQFLQACGSHILVCNMQHHAWQVALKVNGWLRGPSNFALAMSKGLAQAGSANSIQNTHFLRGDGEGPTHL